MPAIHRRTCTFLGIGQAIGNAKVFGDTIHNYTRNDCRRVDLTVQLSYEVDPGRAIALLTDGIARIPNVLPIPAPVIEMFEFTLAGPLLVVRPFCANQHYWQVYFDTNRMIRVLSGRLVPLHRKSSLRTRELGRWQGTDCESCGIERKNTAHPPKGRGLLAKPQGKEC